MVIATAIKHCFAYREDQVVGGFPNALSQKHRKRIEEPFGWAKTIAGMAQTVYRGLERVRSRFILAMAASNPARLPRLLAG
ncbi:Transposase DDE domain-containing protein [Jannaschia seohaensis]|uniref:DDE family transposase n=1 Tax=Jannaschia seohaensis TaxID=475081 RepID=A0A2Y9B4B8_9RHOB|nr:DDE family transposase [Jannaschia seohaensis]SSA49837.1 Transposase DDE domain-containing protein [Jannaschia seohaensis]